MNTETPSHQDIVSYLGKLRSNHQALQELFARIDAADTAASNAQTTIREIGTPQLDDEQGMMRLAGAEKALQLSLTARTETERKVSELTTGETSSLFFTGGQLVRRVLQRNFAFRCSGIATALRPYCRTGDEANAIAGQTSAVKAWAGQLAGYTELYRQFGESPEIPSRDTLNAAFASIDSVLAAAMRMEPALDEFLSSSWSAPTTA